MTYQSILIKFDTKNILYLKIISGVLTYNYIYIWFRIHLICIKKANLFQ